MTDPYRIVKWYVQNNRKDSVAVYIPKAFCESHKLMDNPYLIITNKPDGIMIKPLETHIQD